MKHRWENGDRCVACGLNREGAGAGPYGAMRYFRDEETGSSLKAGECPREVDYEVVRKDSAEAIGEGHVVRWEVQRLEIDEHGDVADVEEVSCHRTRKAAESALAVLKAKP